MKPGLALLAIAVCCLAQQPQLFELRGIVEEPGIGGIAGAEVSIFKRDTTSPLPQTAVTDGRGQFEARVPAGQYMVMARRTGYAPDTQLATFVTADPRPVRVRLERLATITGRVVDPESREPLADVTVYVLRQTGRDGGWIIDPFVFTDTTTGLEAPLYSSNKFIKTDARGTFTFNDVRPGDVAVSLVDPSKRMRLAAEASNSSDDLKPLDREVEFVLWPSGNDHEGTVLRSGAVLNVGDIAARTQQTYRARVTIAQGDCPEGESLRLYLMRSGRPAPLPEAFACGSSVLLKSLEPGSYVLYGVSDWQVGRPSLDGAVWATLPFSVTERNLELTLTPQRGVVIEGRYSMADPNAAAPDFRFAARHVNFVEGVAAPSEEFMDQTSDAEFRIAAQPGQYELILPRGAKAFIKELRYNGAPIRSDALSVNPGSVAQHLEIVLDNRFARLRGNVTEGDRQVLNATVFVMRPGDPSPDLLPRSSDGGYYAELPPGEYRVLARADNILPTAADFKNAQLITLKAGSEETLNVRLTSASR